MSFDPPQYGAPHTGGGDSPTLGTGAAATPPPSPGVPQPKPSNKSSWVLVGVALMVVVVAAVALAIVLTGRDDADVAAVDRPNSENTEDTEDEPSTTTGPSESSVPATSSTTVIAAPTPTLATTVPSTVPPPPPSAAPPVADFVVGTVRRTCGDDSCYLAVRQDSTTGAAELRRVDEGRSIEVECSISGRSVTASMTGYRTDQWGRLRGGGYVSLAYVDGPDGSPLRVRSC